MEKEVEDLVLRDASRQSSAVNDGSRSKVEEAGVLASVTHKIHRKVHVTRV